MSNFILEKKRKFLHLKRYKNGTIEILLITKHYKKTSVFCLVLGTQCKHTYKTLYIKVTSVKGH